MKEKLVQEVIDRAINMYNLEPQNLPLEVSQYECSDVWFYVYFNSAKKNTDLWIRTISLPFHLYTDNIQNWIWFILYLQGGDIDCLEWFTYDELIGDICEWDYSIK